MRRASSQRLGATVAAGLLPAAGAAAQVAPPKPAPAPAGQSPRCTFQIDNVDRQGSVKETPSGTNYFAGGNVRLSCRGQKISMSSDSVAAYGGNVVKFIGKVKYQDSTVTMDADLGTYYKIGERWEARGNVTTRNLKTGSTLDGPSLDYYRELKGVRDTLEMYAVGRPKISYFEADSAGARKPEPYLIVADRVRFEGDDKIWAGGKVTIDRSDFAARADSMRLDTGKGSDGTLLGGDPVLRGLGTDSFRLAGKWIDLGLDNRELSRLVARGQGHALNRDWDLTADTIALDLKERKLEQTRSWGKETRPYAVSRPTPCARTRSRSIRRGSSCARCAATARRGSAATWTRPPRSGLAQGRHGDRELHGVDSAARNGGAEPYRRARGRGIVPSRPERQGAQAALDQLRRVTRSP